MMRLRDRGAVGSHLSDFTIKTHRPVQRGLGLQLPRLPAPPLRLAGLNALIVPRSAPVTASTASVSEARSSTGAHAPPAPSATSASPHPLDSLTPAEIEQVAAVCRARYAEESAPGHTLRFNVITLQEPPKRALLAYQRAPSASTLPPRRASVILQSLPAQGVIEVVVDVRPAGPSSASYVDQVQSWHKIEGVHALITPDDCLDAEDIVKRDPEVRRLLAERYGITDMALLCADPWSVHTTPLGAERRLVQTFLYMRSSPNDNAYAHPLDMVPLVDMGTRRVVRVDLPHSTALPVNMVDNNYHKDLQSQQHPWRTDIKPLNIVQPEGPSFTVDGGLICWQKWRLRVSFNYREGLVLHDVSYQDGDKQRPVLHRMSLVEMAVPYSDPNEPYTRKCAFDVGDYGLGYCTTSLSLGCDCVGDIHYLDAHLSDSAGRPTTIKSAVCIHEEDAGMLWKHVDYRTGHSESRRSRKLVLSFVATVVNYEYGMFIYLQQDGTINYEIKLTGELSTNMLSPGEGPQPQFGTLVGPNGVNAQHHQHMFCARLDLAVDDANGGQGLVVSEVDVVPMQRCAERNPYGNGFAVVETDLTSTSAAQRDTAPHLGRLWKIKNPQVLNPVSGQPVAFKLLPSAGPGLLAAPDSIIATKGHFATHSLWVTPHSDTQRFPAGEYVVGATQCSGLKDWTKQDASLAGADPVLWYSFGVTHIVRVEDFPVMPVETVGFSIKPFGFFNANPGVDIPPSHNAASRSNNSSPSSGSCGECH